MAITYTWKINAVDCEVSKNDMANVVYGVHWSLFAQDEEGRMASIIGMQSVGDPDPENFTPFDELTEEMVVGWIEGAMDINMLKENLTRQIEEIATPKRVTLQLNKPVVEVVEEVVEPAVEPEA